MSLNQNVSNIEERLEKIGDKLEMQSALEDRWRQINDMSLDEFKAASSKVTDYGKYKISESFGVLGTYNENGTCSGGEPTDSSKKACRVATLTVKDKDGNSILGPVSATRVASPEKSVGGGGYNTLITITESGDWVAPTDGWYKFRIKGAGGAGGHNDSHTPSSGWYFVYGGSGGGEGGTTIAYEYLKTGAVVQIDIGKGGIPVNRSIFNNDDSCDGGNTSIFLNGKTYTGFGGEAAHKKTSTYYYRAGGRGGKGDIPGAAGENTSMSHAYASGGAGGGSGAAVSYYAGVTDAKYGGGGAGASAVRTGGTYNPGKGGDGVVWIEYYDPNKK